MGANAGRPFHLDVFMPCRLVSARRGLPGRRPRSLQPHSDRDGDDPTRGLSRLREGVGSAGLDSRVLQDPRLFPLPECRPTFESWSHGAEDDQEPLARKSQPMNLEIMSLDALRAYISDLEAEISRARLEIAAKEIARQGAEQVFRK